MNFITIFGMIYSVTMCTNVTKTDNKVAEDNKNDIALQFYQRWSNTKAFKWLLSTGPKTNHPKPMIHSKKNMAKKFKPKKRIIPIHFCTVTNCYNCNHGLLRHIFKAKSKEERYCKILMIAPDCCHNYFINHGFTF